MSHDTPVEDEGPPFDTREACRRLGISRSTLNRWEKSGRVRRAATVAGKPLWNEAGLFDPALFETMDMPSIEPVVNQLEPELQQLVDEGALADSRFVRHMEQRMRRCLAARALRGEQVAVGELAELMRIDLRIRHQESFERAQGLTREGWT